MSFITVRDEKGIVVRQGGAASFKFGLPISVGQVYHEGDKFEATLKWLKDEQADCAIDIACTLQRYTLELASCRVDKDQYNLLVESKLKSCIFFKLFRADEKKLEAIIEAANQDNPIKSTKQLEAIIQKILDAKLEFSPALNELFGEEEKLDLTSPITKKTLIKAIWKQMSYDNSLADGDAWVKRNTAKISTYLDKDIKIKRWDEWKQEPEFAGCLNLIKNQYKEKNNLIFREAVKVAANEFAKNYVKRNKLDEGRFDYKNARRLCKKYILEECAFLLLVSQKKLYDKILYPIKSDEPHKKMHACISALSSLIEFYDMSFKSPVASPRNPSNPSSNPHAVFSSSGEQKQIISSPSLSANGSIPLSGELREIDSLLLASPSENVGVIPSGYYFYLPISLTGISARLECIQSVLEKKVILEGLIKQITQRISAEIKGVSTQGLYIVYIDKLRELAKSSLIVHGIVDGGKPMITYGEYKKVVFETITELLSPQALSEQQKMDILDELYKSVKEAVEHAETETHSDTSVYSPHI